MIFLYTDDPNKTSPHDLKIAYADQEPSEFEESRNVIVVHAFKDVDDYMLKNPEYRLAFESFKYSYNLGHLELDKTYRNKRTQDVIRIIGYNGRNHKYKFIVQNKTQNNRRYKVTHHYMAELEEVI